MPTTCASPSLTASISSKFFFFNDTQTAEIYTLSLHDALPISPARTRARPPARARGGGGCRRAPSCRRCRFPTGSRAAAVVSSPSSLRSSSFGAREHRTDRREPRLVEHAGQHAAVHLDGGAVDDVGRARAQEDHRGADLLG